MTKVRLDFVLHLIGWEGGGGGEFSAAITKQSESKPMESWITFNTQSKITLFYNLHMVESLPPPEWFTQRNKFEIIFLA